jgi:hypothetical protein
MAISADSGRDEALGGFGKLSPEERAAQNRRLLQRIEASKLWEIDDAERWRQASDSERAHAFGQLAALAEALVRSRGFPVTREPLAFPRLHQLRR